MIESIIDQNPGSAQKNSLDLPLFSKFLNANPIVRTIVLKAINPQIWASENLPVDFKPQSLYNLEVVSEYKDSTFEI